MHRMGRKKISKRRQNQKTQVELMEKMGIRNRSSQEEKMGIRNRSSLRLRDMSWKFPRLMERMDIIYQSRPL